MGDYDPKLKHATHNMHRELAHLAQPHADWIRIMSEQHAKLRATCTEEDDRDERDFQANQREYAS